MNKIPGIVLALILYLLTGCQDNTSVSLIEGDAALQRGDYAGAIAIFLPPAQNGNIDAAYKLGLTYKLIALNSPQDDKGLKGSFEHATITWLGVASDKKHPLASLELAKILRTKNDTTSQKKSLSLLEFAASKGVTGTAYELAQLYLSGIKSGDREIIVKDLAKAITFLEIAASENDLTATVQLALLYKNHPEKDKDGKRALELFKRASDKGHTQARSELAKIYLAKKDDPENAMQAFKLLEKLAKEGDTWALLALAECYENGTGTEVNAIKATEHYNQAYVGGNLQAGYVLVTKYLFAEGIKEDEAKALMIYNDLVAKMDDASLASIKSQIEEMQNFVKTPFKQKPVEEIPDSKMISSYKAQAELGDAASQFKFGKCIEDGLVTNATDPLTPSSTAQYWYEKAALQNHPEAMTALGSIYRQKKDFNKAMLWFKKAAELGFAPAQTKVGVLYDFGYGVERNQKLAAEWYLKAAEKNHTQAMYNLASMYLKGEGVEKNVEQALAWLEKAAALDEVSAITKLAQIYTEEKDVENNPEKKLHWLTVAAEWGVPSALKRLAGEYLVGNDFAVDRAKARDWRLRLLVQNVK